MKRIIVDGATSLVGVALINKAISENVEVYALTRSNSRRADRIPRHNLVHNVECDLANIKNLNGVGTECDVYFHIAWEGTEKGSLQVPEKQIANIQYEIDAVELARRCECKKFVGAGSQAEFGPKKGVMSANETFNPNIAYGFAKLAAYGLSRDLCKEYGITHLWGRIFSLYGGNDIENTLLDYAIKSFLNGKDAFFSSGVQMWDYLNEKDAGEMFFLLGEKCDKSKAYNIAYGKSRPLRKYIEILAHEMNAINFCHFDDKKNSNQGLQADISEIEKDTGFSPKITFESGIKDMINIYRDRWQRKQLTK